MVTVDNGRLDKLMLDVRVDNVCMYWCGAELTSIMKIFKARSGIQYKNIRKQKHTIQYFKIIHKFIHIY